MADLARIIQDDFPKKKIVIIGDLVADQFLNGTISRVSREAPVFILRHDSTETLPGAAANAAANVASLGGKPVLVGLVGNDRNGELLLAELERARVDCNYVVVSETRSTTTKIRVLAGQHYAARQQVIRIDYENDKEVSESDRENSTRGVEYACAEADAIILSDYGYGAVCPENFEKAKSIANSRRIPILIDSRRRLAEFKGATTATPNRDEVEQVLGKDFDAHACADLRATLDFQSLLVTNGNEGMTLFEDARPPLTIDAVGSLEPVDVTGAGDTVIAVYALGLASGLDFADAARLANHAGGIVVMKKRTATVNVEELIESIRQNDEMRFAEQSN